MALYPFSVQRNIVIACAALHNYIRKTAINDSLFKWNQNENVHLEDLQNDASVNKARDLGRTSELDQDFMINLRE